MPATDYKYHNNHPTYNSDNVDVGNNQKNIAIYKLLENVVLNRQDMLKPICSCACI